jgi:hypothetical protein
MYSFYLAMDARVPPNVTPERAAARKCVMIDGLPTARASVKGGDRDTLVG